MSEFYLKDLKIEKFDSLGELGFKKATERKEFRTAIVEPEDFYTEEGVAVTKYNNPNWPIMVRTPSTCGYDHHLGLVDKVKTHLECQTMRQ